MTATSQTAHQYVPDEEIKNIKRFRPLLLGGLCLLSGIVLIVPQIKELGNIMDGDKLMSIATRAFVFMGAVDFLLSFLAFLSFRFVYPLIRVRSTLGMGYLIYTCYVLNYTEYIFPAIIISHMSWFFGTFMENLTTLRFFLFSGTAAFIAFGTLPYIF